MAPNKKIFVLISGRDEQCQGIYYDWNEVKHHVQGIKKSTGVNLLWKSFEGPNREEDAREYWFEHHSTHPTIHRRSTDQTPTRNSSQSSSTSSRDRSPRNSTRTSQNTRSLNTRSLSRDRDRVRDSRQSSSRDRSPDHSQGRTCSRDRARGRSKREQSPHRDTHRSQTRESSRTRDTSRTRATSCDDSRQSSSASIPYNTVANRLPSNRNNPDPHLYQHWKESSDRSVAPILEELELGTHWAEPYLQLRLRKLERLRHQLPSPPAHGRDSTRLNSPILTDRWCDENSIPIPTDIVDREYKLTTESYRRILYTESWDEKDTHIVKYIETVDGQRDFALQHLCDVTYQCVSRQTLLLRKNATDVEQLEASQDIQKSLFEQNQRLLLANKALKQRNIRAHNKKTVQFEPTTNAVPNSPLKKLKINSPTDTPTKLKAKKSTALSKSPSITKSLPIKKSNSVDSSAPPSIHKKTKHLSKSTPLVKSVVQGKTTRTKRPPSNQDIIIESGSEESDGIVTTPESSDGGGEFRSEYSQNADLQEVEDNIDVSKDFEEEDLNIDDGSDTESDHRESFGFEDDHPDCSYCVAGSGRKQGHVGRHTRTLSKEPPLST